MSQMLSIIFEGSGDILIDFFVVFQSNPDKKLCGKFNRLGMTTITVTVRRAAAAAAFYFAKSR